MRILVADDDLISLMALEKSLTEMGYEVVAAKNGLEAWEKIVSDPSIQIIILDWMMPGLDGLSLIKKIKSDLSEEKQLPRHIIMLSGTDGYEEIIKGLSSGADDYLVKPYSFNELRIRVKRAEKMLKLEEEKYKLMSLDPVTLLWNRKKNCGILARGAGPRFTQFSSHWGSLAFSYYFSSAPSRKFFASNRKGSINKLGISTEIENKVL